MSVQQVVLGFKVSELNISMLIARENDKGKYTSRYQAVKYEGEACINGKSVPEKKLGG